MNFYQFNYPPRATSCGVIIASLTVLKVREYGCAVKLFMSRIKSKPSYVESLNVEYFESIFKIQTLFVSSKL